MDRRRLVAVAGALVGALPALVALGAQGPTREPWIAPRTADGQPDLQGVWDTRTLTPLERPEELADRPFLSDAEAEAFEQRTIARRDDDAQVPTVHAKYWLDYGNELFDDNRTSLIVDPPTGRVPPPTAAARARATARRATREARGPADSWDDRTLFERCITRGLPTVMLPAPYNGNIRILQSAGTVAIVTEMMHEARIVPLDDRPHLPADHRQWLGDSRGWWDGETLIVETTNFTDRTPFRGSSARMRLTERFTRVAPDVLAYEVTVADPATWARPWTVSFPMARASGVMYEYACHEGNYALRNILSYARDAESRPAR